MALREVLASFGIDVDDKQLKAAAAKIQEYETALQNLSKEEKAQLAAYKQAADVQAKAKDAADAKANADKAAAKEARERAKAQSEMVTQLRAEFIVNAAKQVVSAFTGMIKSSLDLAGSLGDTADKLGVSTTELQQFQFAGRLAGVSSEEMSQSLGFLNKNLGETAAGQGQAGDAFTKLGVNIKDANGHVKSATDLLPEIADGVNKLGSQGEKTATVMAIFGRSGANLLPLFKDGSKGIQEALARFKELGLEIDKNFITQAHEVGDEVETMHIQFDVLKTKLVAAALPALKQLSDIVLKLGAFFGKLLENTNASIIIFAAFAGGALLAAVAGFNALAVAVGLSLSELLLIIAVFALVALAVEDIYTLFTGGDSVIGRFIDKLFGVGASKKFVEEVKTTVGELWEQFKTLIPTLESLWTTLKSLFGDGATGFALLKAFVGGWALSLRFTADVVSAVISQLKFLFSIADAGFSGWVLMLKTVGDFLEYLIGKVTAVASKISSIPGIGAISSLAGGALGGTGTATASAIGAVKGGSSSVNQQNQTTINVNGADQPQSVAAKVASSLTDTVESKFRNAANAVASIF